MAGSTLFDRDHESSLSKIHNIGFMEQLPLERGHYFTFDRMREGKLVSLRDYFAHTICGVKDDD
ncbi:hypothetical protein N7453_011496 [Penicillium expansum]|nr:hypothetical protein N7453_011496 [Penicillium expansum]